MMMLKYLYIYIFNCLRTIKVNIQRLYVWVMNNGFGNTKLLSSKFLLRFEDQNRISVLTLQWTERFMWKENVVFPVFNQRNNKHASALAFCLCFMFCFCVWHYEFVFKPQFNQQLDLLWLGFDLVFTYRNHSTCLGKTWDF